MDMTKKEIIDKLRQDISLSPASLRLASDVLIKLNQIGFYQAGSFIHMPKSVLRQRFGNRLVLRLYQALRQDPEFFTS